MDWFSRKIVLWQIKKYFHIENQEQVEVHLLGDHSLKCTNLKLRNNLFNTQTSKIHIQQLSINSLSIAYSTTSQQPLKVSLDGAKLNLAFNQNYNQPPPSYANTKQQMQKFFNAIKSKQILHSRGFFSQQIYQLKKLIGEFFIKKVSLLIQNVDISIRYGKQQEVHVIGCELGEINIKQRMVINHQDNEDKEMKEEQIICTLQAVSAYLGISSEEDRIQQLAYNREILRKTKSVRKNYLLDKQKIQIYYNINKNSLAIRLSQLTLKTNKLLLVELMKASTYLQTYLSQRPLIRPGRGDFKQITFGTSKIKMRLGTQLWWKYTLERVVERVQQMKQNNILTNYKYRLYLFYIIYKFTYGSTNMIDKYLSEYEEKKLSYSIMSAYSMILNKIDRIKICKESDKQTQQLEYFVNFICRSRYIIQVCNKNGLKKVTYQKIKSSKVYYNLFNCNQFIRDYSNKSAMDITFNIQKNITAEIHEGKYDKILLKEGFNLSSFDFHTLKNKYLNKFYKKMTEEGVKWEKPFLLLQIPKIHFFQNKSEMKVVVPSVLVTGQLSQVLLKINNIIVCKQNKTIYAQSNKIIVCEKNYLLKITSIFINLQKGLIQHLLTINTLIATNNVQPLSEQEEFESYLQENIYKRLPKHPFFQNFSEEATNIQIDRILIGTSAFEDDQNFGIDLNSLNYSIQNSMKPPKFSLDKLSIARCKFQNIQKIKNSKLQKLNIQQESLILENNKPLALTAKKYLRKHNGHTYYESVLDIVVPFLLIQLSFKDIYYFQLFANYWSEIFKSPHFFSKRRAKSQSEMKVVELNQDKIDYFQRLNTKSSRTRIKFQGVQIILYGQNNRSPENQVLTMLLEGILYQNKIYILGTDMNLSIYNVFVENCLGSKTFNHLKLIQIIQKKQKTNEPLIYSSKFQSDTSNLLLYGLNQTDSDEKAQNHLIKIKIKNIFSIKKFKKNQNIYITIKPLFLFHSSDYYRILMKSFDLISKNVKKSFHPVLPVVKTEKQQSQHEILEAKSISQKTTLVCKIQKINLIALHQNEPIYTFSFLDFSMKNQSEAYLSKIQIIVSEFYIVDISNNCGLHPIVIKAVPLQCFLISYQSDLLKKKEKKSALLKIKIHNSELFYLNRKIKQLTNFIMSHFQQKPQEEIFQKQSNTQQKIKQYPFCYRVQFIKPVIMLLRSSLSEQKMVSQAQNLLIANYLQGIEEFQQTKDFFYDASRVNINSESFESCIEIKQQQIQFHSFAKAEQEQQSNQKPKLHINLLNFYVYNDQKAQKDPVIYTPQIVITLVDKHLNASLKSMEINFTADDYRLLIRITEQNFSETPVSYPKDSVQTQQKYIGFKSSYMIEELKMVMREDLETQKFGELVISHLSGVNILYSNGQKEDIITIDKIQYESCIKNNLQKIISKKILNSQILSQIKQPNDLIKWDHKQDLKEIIKKYSQKIFDESNHSEVENAFYKNASKFDFSLKQEPHEKDTLQRGVQDTNQKQQTNLNRLGKWIKGMCKKCMCCCKNETHEDENSHLDKVNQQKIQNSNEQSSHQKAFQHQNYVNLQDSFIEQSNQIINFCEKIKPQNYIREQKKQCSVFLHIKGQKSKEKRMYMLVQHLNIYYQKNQHIIALSNFLGKPYTQIQRPSYLRDAKFNNYRPFQAFYQIANTSIYAIQKQAVIQRSIRLDIHLHFNMEKIGDPNNGPGKKNMQSDISFKIFFEDKKDETSIQISELSEVIRIIYERSTKVNYRHHEPIKNDEKLLVIGLQKEAVKFNFPIYSIKSLMELSKSFKKSPKKQQAQRQQEKQKQLKPFNKANNESELDLKKSSKIQLKQKNKKQQEKIRPLSKTANSIVSKKYYIPKIQFSIETKQNVNFINMYLQNTTLKGHEMTKDQNTVRNQIIDLDILIQYWNLNLGKFEPFLQKCKFVIEKQIVKYQKGEKNRLKVTTKSQKDLNSYDYRNGLCINLTTAFFHTYKQLQLKYLLQNNKIQISNQVCYDLTKKNTSAYTYMQTKRQLQPQIYKSEAFVRKFPEELKNFFGRQFKVEDIAELSKKKSKRNQILVKNRFHIEGVKVFLHHSYLQPRTKLKYITYRTPFRIYNTTPFLVSLRFKTTNRMARNTKWLHQISTKDYYSIPEDIYEYDFLVNISAEKRHKQSGEEDLSSSILRRSQLIEQQFDNTISTKYLIQMNANKSDYHVMGKHKLNQYLFNLSNIQKRQIDKRDIVIKSNKLTMCIISIKTQCQEHNSRSAEKVKMGLYDSLTIIISPIIIYNYTSQNFNLTSCKKKKYQLLSSKSIELYEFPAEIKLSDIAIQFLEDPVHHQYRLLELQTGVHFEIMLIDRMQSVNIKTIKQTYNTCIVQIYPDWLIINRTQLQFHLYYENKEFIVSEKSSNSLAIAQWRNKKNMPMQIKLVDDHNQSGDFHKFGTETNIIDMFMLSKIDPVVDSDSKAIEAIKKQIRKKGCCGRIQHPQRLTNPEKINDERVFKCIQFIITIQESPNYILTKNLTIDYKYQIINQTKYEMVIYQHSFDQIYKINNQQENGVQILRLQPKQKSYFFTYDFLSKQYYLKINYQGQFIYSNRFPCDESIGRSLSLKLKRTNNHDNFSVNNAYHESFHYIRIDMQQIKYKNILTFSFIDGQVVKYPFYINNATNYFLKITQNGQNFKVKPKARVPFSWSNLITNTHEIEVQVEGESMTYSLKEKSEQFKPIIIRGDNIAGKSNRNINKKLFKRQKCLVKWKGLNGQYLVIFDIFSKRIHINAQQAFFLLLSQAERLVSSSNKIEIYFENRQIFEFHPSPETIKQWTELLRNDLNTNILDKIYFTIESFQNSMIYFIHNLQFDEDNDVKLDHQQYIVQNFFLSIINSNPLRIQEILLINMQNIEVILENKLSSIKEGQKQSYLVKKGRQTIKIKKMKINNQLKHALNPVVVSQIKKSNYPFLQIKRQKQNLVLWQDQNNNNQQNIVHYKSSIFFLDEAELIIEAALIPEALNFKKSIDQIQNQYAYDENQEKKASSKAQQKKQIMNNQIYIDYLEIKPIKMTISVSFDANIDKQFQPSLMNFLTLIPSGVENAIITIDSFVFHHVFMEQKRLRQTLNQYYLYQLKKQILFNAGSIQILAPFQLIRGLGVGFTSIFYNPFYQLVNTKQIKSFTSNMLEGFITFFIFILTLGFSVINGIFKFIAVFTKDNNFQTRREKFRKQIFKSPVDGFSYGARYLVRIFKEFFYNFVTWPCEYNKKIPCLGLIFGFLLALINIIPWILKMIISLYDFFYVIGLGFISWGYYQQNSMKYRSRPIRTFPHKQLLAYDYLTAKGNEIMRKNLIEENDNEEISFISHIEADDESRYLLLSNYRILYCSHQLTSFKQITLYKIFKVEIGPLTKNKQNGIIEDLYITVFLTFPDKNKYLCLECSTNSYELKFKDLKSMKDFLQKLKQNLENQRIDFNLEDESLRKYEKSLQGQSGQKMKKNLYPNQKSDDII